MNTRLLDAVKNDLLRQSLTSVPLQLDFARRMKFKTDEAEISLLDQVHAWMAAANKELRAAFLAESIASNDSNKIKESLDGKTLFLMRQENVDNPDLPLERIEFGMVLNDMAVLFVEKKGEVK